MLGSEAGIEPVFISRKIPKAGLDVLRQAGAAGCSCRC